MMADRQTMASREKRILVDGKNIALPQGTGVATYARSLCRNLAMLDADVQLLYGHRSPAALAWHQKRPAFLRYAERLGKLAFAIVPTDIGTETPLQTSDLRQVDGVSRYWRAPYVFDRPSFSFTWHRFQAIRNVMNADAAHWTYPVPTRLNGAANIYTLHDLVPLKLPETTLDNKRAYHAMIRKITQTADLIVTVSEQSKADIHDLFDVPDERVVNTYQDVDIPAELLAETMDQVAGMIAADFQLEAGRFLLFYGAIEPKKNVGRLIEAHLSSGLDMPLVIVGKDGWLMENELRAYNQHLAAPGGSLRVIRLPYVTRAQLVRLTRAALAVTFPSIYEGFGLPLVEAMLFGTPLLTSNIGAMREIAGDAALLVDPYDVASIAKGLCRIAGEASLRDELVDAGRIRAETFSSTAYRARLRDAYARIG
ncbi:Glycosyltransferase involved in cell wall bisynthesis [Rhizobium sp. RU20A]|uniref:glycosyltransferase family 4 protein n=1 Tax=Rhizobium sp. RU20A TaxID=1907412 RepID=UPI000956F886|nr:glycosyltransferase family 1 protein [Rhizobium sp. RU20A]SIQ59166.1 Glycosyltransferase involved in cell wall bisynthesis [Rhizobium sp. RU20A]